MVLYLSLLYNAYKEKNQGQTKESIMKQITDLEARLKELIIENEELKSVKGTVEIKVKDLTEKLQVETEEKRMLLTSKEEVETVLGTLKETYSKEKTDLNSTITELEENITLLKSASGENQHQLESAKEEVKKERDIMREELQKAKAQLTKEKEDLQSEHEELLSNVRRVQKAKEELEEKMKLKQEEHSRSVHLLRKHLLQHVRDLHVWKVFLEQDREYESEDLHVVMEPEIDSILPFSKQVSTLDTAINEENVKLDSLQRERQEEDALAAVAKSKQITAAKKREEKKREAQTKEVQKVNLWSSWNLSFSF